jgi:hypothetical protein
VKVDAPLGFIPSPAKLETIRVQSNRKSKNPTQASTQTTNRFKASTQSKTTHTHISIVDLHRDMLICSGLDLIDQNIPGFADDNLGNDGDGDSLTKSKLNLNAMKDKKKPFFKKVSTALVVAFCCRSIVSQFGCLMETFHRLSINRVFLLFYHSHFDEDEPVFFDALWPMSTHSSDRFERKRNDAA